MTTVVTDQPTMQMHHTEYMMPASGMLFANDHLAGRTFIFDLRNPLSPKIVASFGEWRAICIRIPICGSPMAMCSRFPALPSRQDRRSDGRKWRTGGN